MTRSGHQRKPKEGGGVKIATIGPDGAPAAIIDQLQSISNYSYQPSRPSAGIRRETCPAYEWLMTNTYTTNPVHGSALLVLDQGLAASTFQIHVDHRRDERPVFVHDDHVGLEHLAVFRAGASLRVHSQPALWVRHLTVVDAGEL